MKIISINVNGIRSAAKKGLFGWLAKQNADVICLQEVRAHGPHLDNPDHLLEDYHCYFEPAEKLGYSGVAIFSREKPQHVVKKLGYDLADIEGRYIHIELNNLTIASLYMPSGTSGDGRQTLKYAFMEEFSLVLEKFRAENRSCIICGDWNIAHKIIDIKNWRANQNHSGFLPEERAWLDELFDKKGWVDAFRVLNQEPSQYTWWSNRGRAWENNVGWRIDYQVITPDLKDKVRQVSIYKEQKFSDHAPLIMEYDV